MVEGTDKRISRVFAFASKAVLVAAILLSSYRKRQAQLAFEQWPSLIGRIVPVRTTWVSLPCGLDLLAKN